MTSPSQRLPGRIRAHLLDMEEMGYLAEGVAEELLPVVGMVCCAVVAEHVSDLIHFDDGGGEPEEGVSGAFSDESTAPFTLTEDGWTFTPPPTERGAR